MQCDMCGAQTQLFKVEIEGVQLNVCQSCSKFGQVITNSAPIEDTPQKKVITEIYKDLSGGKIVNRLLQGDVGSGKPL